MRTSTLIFLLVVLVALICLAVALIPPVRAGGYAPIPVDPYEHQTAAEAQQIAGALVDFRGTYGAMPAPRPQINRNVATPVYPSYENGLIIFQDGSWTYDVVSNRCHVA
jgi:hypothetical protein